MTPVRVLLVDDNALNLELASFVLDADGIEVAGAADAEQAQAQLTAFDPQLVLMDVQLPGMDGLALTRRLKADPATAHVKVVAFTAYAMKGNEEKMRAAGFDGYLAKPIDVAKFAGLVRALADQ